MKRIMRNSKNSLFGSKNPEEQPVHAEAKPIEGVTSETQETELAPIVEESCLTERDVYDFVKAYGHDFSQAAATAKDNSLKWMLEPIAQPSAYAMARFFLLTNFVFAIE